MTKDPAVQRGWPAAILIAALAVESASGACGSSFTFWRALALGLLLVPAALVARLVWTLAIDLVAGLYLREPPRRRSARGLLGVALLLWPARLVVRPVVLRSRYAGSDLEIRLTWALTLALAFAAALWLVALAARSGRRPLHALVLLGAAAAGVAINHRLLAGQYPTLHALVAAMTLPLAAAGVLALGGPALGARRPAIAATLLLAISLPALSGPGPRDFSPAGRLGPPLFEWLGLGHRSPAVEASSVAGEYGRVLSGRRQEWLQTIGRPAPTQVVLITIDTLRAQNVGWLGYRRNATTPFLDRFAAESLVFERAYSQAAHSLVSIRSTFVGRYATSLNAIRTLRGTRQAVEEIPLALSLRGNGFTTRGLPSFSESEISGKFKAFAEGFDRFERPPSTKEIPTADSVTEAALAELKAMRGQRGFLWMHFMNVHGPHDDVEPRFGRTPLALYDAAIRDVDEALERFFARAGQESLLDEALVVLHADHGEEFREHGALYHGTTLYEEAIHVPLLLWMKGAPPRRVSTPVELVDLVPTIHEALGIEAPRGLHGDSLIPCWLGADPGGIVLAQMLGGGSFLPDRSALIESRYKIIAFDSGESEEFFDLVENPGESPGRGDEVPSAERDRLRRKLAAARLAAADLPPAVKARPAIGLPAVEEAISRDLASPVAATAIAAIDAACAEDPSRFLGDFERLLLGPHPGARDAGVRSHLLARLRERPPRGTREMLRRGLDAAIDVETKRALIDVYVDFADADDASWFDGWVSGQDAALGDDCLLLAAVIGRPGARDRLLAILEPAEAARLRPTLFARAAARLGREQGSPFRRALIAAVILPEPAPFYATFALGALAQAKDPVAIELLTAVHGVPGILDDAFDTALLARLRVDPVPLDRAGPVLAQIAWHSADQENRAGALGLLARLGRPSDLLDEAERRRREARPIGRLEDLGIVAAPGSMQAGTALLPAPLNALALRWTGGGESGKDRVGRRIAVELALVGETRRACLFLEADGSAVVSSLGRIESGAEWRLIDAEGREFAQGRWPGP